MNPLRARLVRANGVVFSVYATSAAFCTYFCMYAFRKPYSAGTYEGLDFYGTALDLKTAFALSQLIGYTISKYIGVRICSERVGDGRARLLVQLILLAFTGLFLFGVLPEQWKWLGLFVNGLPLGMIWGICVSFLEGRKTSDALLAGLSCSFIVASGVVKDVGRWLMSDWAVPEFWMPFAAGALFLPGFMLSVWFLKQLPGPDDADVALRSARVAMDRRSRWEFVRRFGTGLVMLIVAYTILTGFRDFRDIYQVELFMELDPALARQDAIFSRSELAVAFGVMLAMGMLNFVKDNRRGFYAAFWVMGLGFALIGLSTWALERDLIGGMTWMIGTGLGSYLAYVPYNSVLFERMMAYTRYTGTAVFAIYLADASGYTGVAALYLYKDLFAVETTRLEFFMEFCYLISVVGVALLLCAAIYFRGQRGEVSVESTG